MIDKKSLRQDIKKLANSLPDTYFPSADAIIFDKIISSDIYQSCKTIFTYVSTSKEPDTLALINHALSEGKTVCVPKCRPGRQMDAIEIKTLEDLQAASFGILEPVNNTPIVSPKSIELGIIPCVSANLRKERLGHGGGYYDIFLQESPMYKMCLCYKALLTDEIPLDDHDILMDEVITN